MPSDITGTDIIEEDQATGSRRWTFVPGPIFGNIVLADEINRTPPKTQSALLEQRQSWKDAIPEEQKVLQHLLRAEATFREIEIAFGAGGGGGSDAGRDLASLFDLELDTQCRARVRIGSAGRCREIARCA